MIHIYPVEEEDLHELDGTSCPCGVMLNIEEVEIIVIHQRFAPVEGEEGIIHPAPKATLGNVGSE
jgi:hypothetical protein